MNNNTIAIAIVTASLALAGCTGTQIASNPDSTQPSNSTGTTYSGIEVVNSVSLQNDYTGAKVAKSDLKQGCFAKDCIPSIDDPVFESATEADEWLNDEDRVFAIDLDGVQRAYPQRILNWHEIVNDQIGDTWFAVTFCPLCGSVTGFNRQVNGTVTEFGVSGKLHDSDLVMYDRLEGNLWQQVTGQAIVGPAAQRDEMLQELLISTTTWGEWKSAHPETEVLSRQTGYIRDYGRYPYGTYESDDELFFGVEELDTSLQIKTPVYGIEVAGASKAYPEADLQAIGTIQDTIAGVEIEIVYTEEGTVTATNLDTAEELVPLRLFWFAWAAFHPDTELYIQE